MKIGFIARNDLAGVEEDAAFAAEHGFAGLEFNFWGDFDKLDADTVEKIKAVLDDHDVACSSAGRCPTRRPRTTPPSSRRSSRRISSASRTPA